MTETSSSTTSCTKTLAVRPELGCRKGSRLQRGSRCRLRQPLGTPGSQTHAARAAKYSGVSVQGLEPPSVGHPGGTTTPLGGKFAMPTSACRGAARRLPMTTIPAPSACEVRLLRRQNSSARSSRRTGWQVRSEFPDDRGGPRGYLKDLDQSATPPGSNRPPRLGTPSRSEGGLANQEAEASVWSKPGLRAAAGLMPARSSIVAMALTSSSPKGCRHAPNRARS